MISKKIGHFSPKQLASLLGFPYPLIQPPGNASEEVDWVSAFSAYLLGEGTWENAIDKELENKNLPESFQLLTEATENGEQVALEIIEKLDLAWQETVTIAEKNRDSIEENIELLVVEDPHIREFIEDIRNRLARVKISKKRPDTTADILKAFEKLEAIEALQEDAQEISVLVNEYHSESSQAFLKQIQTAFDRILTLIENGELLDESPEAELFRILPEIVLARDRQVLEKICDQQNVWQEIVADLDPSYRLTFRRPAHVAPRSIRRIADTPFEVSHVAFEEVRLKTFSQAVYSQAAVRKAPASFEDIEKIKNGIYEGYSLQEIGNRLLGSAKSCDVEKLRLKALGEGLLLHGLDQMYAFRYDHARKLLVDALNCLAEGSIDGHDSIEDTVFAILTSWIWPQASAMMARVENVKEWLESPKPLMRHLRSGRFLDVVAKIWADELSLEHVADRFLEIVSANLGDDRTLFRHCTEKLLTPYNLVRNAERVFLRLKWLLMDAEPPAKIYQLFDRLAEEINPGSDDRISSGSGKLLNALAEELSVELERLPKECVAPLKETSAILPDLIKNLGGRGATIKTSDPEVTVRKLVNILYPEERQLDFEFPVAVSNTSNNAPASDVTLVLRYGGADKKWSPNITTGVVNIGELVPGQQKEAIFIMDLPEGLSSSLTEWRFNIEIQTDGSTKRQGFTVKIRPSTRGFKSSPYVPGPAVSGEQFIGRKSEMRRLLSTLCGDKNNLAIAVYGIRRIGKTSILKQIKQNLEVQRRYYPVFWDVEDWSRPASDFMAELSEKILSAIPERFRAKALFQRDEFTRRPFAAFEGFLESLDAMDLPRRVLLMIDEFDKLIHLSQQAYKAQSPKQPILKPTETFSPEIFASLRKALMTRTCFSMIIAGLPVIMQQKYEQRFFGLLEPIQVHAFDPKEAEEILRASESVMRISTKAREMIFEASGLQPYILQLICNELFHRMKFSGRDLVAPFDLKEVVEQKILPNENYFTDYERLVGDARPVIYGLALGHRRAGVRGRNFVSISDIQQELAREGIEYDQEFIKVTLDSLTEKYASNLNDRPLVERAKNNPRWFKLIIGLLGEHLIRLGLNSGEDYL